MSMLELRPEVAEFAQAMERKLRANDHRPGWGNDHPQALLARMKDEAGELEGAAYRCWVSGLRGAEVEDLAQEVLYEAADVANFAMMVADVCGRHE